MTAAKRSHGDGSVRQRGPTHWQLRWRANGKARSATFHGSRGEANQELRRLLRLRDEGANLSGGNETLATYLTGWLDNDTDLSPKTRERYRQLVAQQIVPYLGNRPLRDLRPALIAQWHGELLQRGGAYFGPLSPRTVGHAHRVLHRALERALMLEIVGRNVAHAVRPPRVPQTEAVSLTAEQMTHVLALLTALPIYPIVAFALGTGMRRGEICALAWGAVDLDVTPGTVRVERSLEQTREGLRFKVPKSRAGLRTISLPASVVAILREHRRKQAEHWLASGLGRPGDDALVFARSDGSAYPPNDLSRDWRRLVSVRGLELPRVPFHALRHSHASVLIAGAMDIGAVSRRLGHSNPATTLRIYTHAFSSSDVAAAAVVDRAFTKK
jgi:integrase